MRGPPPTTVIRVSSLNAYPGCARQAATSIFWKEIADAGYRIRESVRGVGAAVGTAVHKAAEFMLREKATSGSLPPANFGQDVARDSIKEQVAEGIQFDDGNRAITRTAGEAIDQGARMSRLYHGIVAPEVNPIIVEERLTAEVRPGIILSGQPDVVAREPNKVRDLKTGGRMGDYGAQTGGYSLLVRSHDLHVEEASVDFIKRVRDPAKQTDPVVKPVPIAEAETTALNIIRHIEQDISTFRYGDPERGIRPQDPWAFMANPHSVLCSRKFCRAYGTDFCDAWKIKEAE